MNSIMISGVVATEVELRYTAETQKPIAQFWLEVAGLKEGDPSHRIQVTGWNNTAQTMKESIQEGQFLLVKGRCNINVVDHQEGFKQKKPEIGLVRFWHLNEDIGCNELYLVGRAGRDPEVRYFESGTVVTKGTQAVDRNKRDADPDWFDWECWGKTAEIAASYVRKGTLLGITGALKVERWQDRQTGSDRSKPSIRVDELKLLGNRRDNDSADREGEFDYGAPAPRPAPNPYAPTASKGARRQEAQPVAAGLQPAPEIDYDDIPF